MSQPEMKYLIFGNKEKSKPSFKSEVFLCVNKELAIPSRSTEFLNRNQLGDINMCEVSVDGRFIVTLENKDQRTLKVWYNNYHKLESKICRTNSQKIMIAESQFQVFWNLKLKFRLLRMMLIVMMIILIFKSKQDLKFRMTAMKLNFIHIRNSEKIRMYNCLIEKMITMIT